MIDEYLEFLRLGGPIMLPLTVIGVIVFTMAIYQLFWLAVWRHAPRRYLCGGAPRWAERALTIARDRRGFPGFTLADSIELCLSRVDDCLTRRVPTLRFLAQISTLLGFLGTATGLVKVFSTVAQKGVATPGDLAGGIYEKMFTTVYGLVLALIAGVFSHLIHSQARQDLLLLELRVIDELDRELPAPDAGSGRLPPPSA